MSTHFPRSVFKYLTAREKSLARRTAGLTAEEIQHDPLCSFCQTQGIWAYLTSHDDVEKRIDFVSTPDEVHLPHRQSCPLCRIVFDLLPVTAFAEEHLREYQPYSNSKIPFVHLARLKRKVGSHVFTSLLVTYNYKKFLSHTHTVNSNYRGEVALSSPLRHRLNIVGVSPAKVPAAVDHELIRKCVRECLRHHRLCHYASHSTRNDTTTPMIFVDVNQGNLVERDTGVAFVALSYVWGKVPTLKTVRATKSLHMSFGYLFRSDIWPQIPQTIQDCVLLTQRLKCAYLWVDCLCIVQDDPSSTPENVLRMDRLYSKAMLTIIPIDAKGAADPLPGVRPGNNRTTCSRRLGPDSNARTESREIIVTNIPSWRALMEDPTYMSRAWTLQEELLSIRCLYLSRWGMWFSCLTSRYSDVEFGELPHVPENRIYLPLMREQFNLKLDPDDWRGWDFSTVDEFEIYAMHAEWYSGRNLTYREDRNAAFAGILGCITDTCQQEFLWGHPVGKLFPASLLWVHVDTGPISKPQYTERKDVLMLNDYMPERDTAFPTWSWMGWSNKITFHIFPILLADHQIDLQMDEDFAVAHLSYENVDVTAAASILTPELLHRSLNQGFSHISGATISAVDMCCRASESFIIEGLDDDSLSHVLANELYPYSMEQSLVLKQDEMPGSCCGMLFGHPFWGYDNPWVFVRIKSIAGASQRKLKRRLIGFHEYSYHKRDDIFDNDEDFCLALALSTSGSFAERQGVALFNTKFFESYDSEIKKFTLV